jgi:hypothetical protein
MFILLPLLLMFQQSAAKPAIEGRVIQADSPDSRVLAIPDARVELSGRGAPRIVRTDREGRFRIADIDAGEYRVKVNADGFAAAEYGQPAINLPGTPLTVANGASIPQMDFKLIRAATISGRVYDYDNEPLGGAIVQLYRAVAGAPGPAGPRTTPAAFVRTDDRGEYRFYWLTPDEYYVSVNYTSARLGPAFVPANPNMLPAPNGYRPMYYRNSADVAGAEKLALKAGEERAAVDLHLVRAGIVNISGTVTDKRTGRGVQAQVQLLGNAPAQALTDAAGRYELRNIPSGSYRMAALAITEDLVSERRVEVGDINLTGIDIVMDPGAPVRGKIVSDDGAPIPNIDRISIYLNSTENPGGQTRVQTTGEFEVPNVTSGSYIVMALSLPEDFYMKSATLGRADAMNRPAPFSADIPDSLQIVLSSASGRIRGTVVAANGAAFPGAQVVLVPEETLRDRTNLFKTATADQTGTFALRGIPPGNYFLFAWNFLEPRAYADPAFLRRYEQNAVAIKIEGTVQSTIRVPVSVREQ